MKKYLFLFLGLVCSSFLMAQANREKPSESENSIKVPAINKNTKEDLDLINSPQVKRGEIQNSYTSLVQKYQQQWKRYSQNPQRRTLSETEKDELQNTLLEMSKMEPQRWETSLAYYLLGQHETNRFNALKNAYKLNPTNADVLKQMASFYHITGDFEKEREMIVQIYKNQVYSAFSFQYADDLLASCEKNGTLITHGLEDALTVRYVQLVQGKRKDVNLINLEWMNSENYLKKLKGNSFKLPSSDVIDPSFLQVFCKENEDRLLHLSLTIASPYLSPILTNCFVRGLTFFYSSVLQDLIITNKDLWTKQLKHLPEKDQKNPLVVNYLPLLFQLRRDLLIRDVVVIDQLSPLINKIIEEQKLPEKSKNL